MLPIARRHIGLLAALFLFTWAHLRYWVRRLTLPTSQLLMEAMRQVDEVGHRTDPSTRAERSHRADH